MSRKPLSPSIREIGWLAFAVVMALIIAGASVRRLEDWSSWNGQSTFGPIEWIDLGERGVVPLEIIRFRHATTIEVAWWDQRRSPLPGERVHIPGSLFEMEALDRFETVCRVGWPLRYAECSASGWPPWQELPTVSPPPWQIERGLIELGPLPLATRPVFPGFLLLVAACEGTLLLARGSLWLLLGGRRRSRMRQGLCGRCGYDLTGVDGVCPECGTSFT